MSNFCTFSQAKPNERDPFKIPAYPEYPKLRLGTQLDAIYERLYRDGYGIRGFRALSPKCWLFSILDARGPTISGKPVNCSPSKSISSGSPSVYLLITVRHKRLQCWHRRIAGMFCESMKSFSLIRTTAASILRPSALPRLIGIMFGRMPVFSERLEALQFL
mgnify:FL=1